MGLPNVCLVVAVVLFAIGAWSRWWPVDTARGPFYGSFLSAGLFFWALSQLLGR